MDLWITTWLYPPAQALQKDLEAATWASQWQHGKHPRVALVGHGMAADLKLLDSMGVVIPAGGWS